MNPLSLHIDFAALVRETSERGWSFVDEAVPPEVLRALRREAGNVDLQVGDHVTTPIWKGSKREVRQLHARFYAAVGDPLCPVASELSRALGWLGEGIPELAGWVPSEIGYQHYRGPTDFISPHRDRRTDGLLSVTITISGRAVVRFYDPAEDPDDYRNLELRAEHETKPGTLLLLRAPGLGSGIQCIHEVLPPTTEGGRLILNLRTRSNVLPPPEKL